MRGRWLPLILAFPAALAGQQRWAVKEDLRIGSLDEGPALFSDIRSVAVNGRGEIFVLDYKTQDIRVFDAAGKFVRRIGRSGSGPGELRTANGMLIAPDGRLWVNDPGNARFSVFDAEGKSVATHVLGTRGYGFTWTAVFDTSGVLFDQIFAVTPGSSNVHFRRVRTDGTVIDTVAVARCARQRATEDTYFRADAGKASTMVLIPFVAMQASILDARGFVWCSPADAYEILQFGLVRGDTGRHIRRDATPLTVTTAEREAAIERTKKQFRQFPDAKPDFSRIPKTKPILQSLDIDDRGNIWVRRVIADTLKASFDVLDRIGKQIAVAELPWRLSPYFRLTFRGDYVYGVMRDEDDVPYVVRAKISRPRAEP